MGGGKRYHVVRCNNIVSHNRVQRYKENHSDMILERKKIEKKHLTDEIYYISLQKIDYGKVNS